MARLAPGRASTKPASSSSGSLGQKGPVRADQAFHRAAQEARKRFGGMALLYRGGFRAELRD